MSAWLSSWLIAAALAQAPVCEGGPADWISTLSEQADPTAYLCLALEEAAHDPLVAAVQAVPAADANLGNRLRRALAIHLMQRLDRPLEVEDLRLLSASDRRLLRDAVQARKGRATPVAAHARVFEQFDWYHPDPGYTQDRLDAQDRDNMALLDAPPPAPKAEGGSAAEAVAAAGEQAVPQGMCSCGAGAPGPWWVLGAVLWGRRRRAGRG